MELQFNDLPKAVSNIQETINNIERLLLAQNNNAPVEINKWFDLTELCAYLPDKPAKATVYNWVRNDLIPYHKGSKKLRFLKSEIDHWLKVGRKKSNEEVALYLKMRKK